MPKVSVLIPTYNNARTIGRCLDSVRWADEIVVIDSLSTDGTHAICEKRGANVIAQAFAGYAKQKNMALDACQHEWILQLDSDEYVGPDFGQVVRQTLAQVPNDVDAYQFARKNQVLGQWVQGMGLYPDFQTRLFRKAVGRFKEREVHERLEVPGRVLTLPCAIEHEGMPRISKQVANLNRYTQFEANELYKHGKKFHWYELVLRPLGVFGYRYFWQRGIWAGYRGLILTSYLAFYSFLTYAKLWELEALGQDNL